VREAKRTNAAYRPHGLRALGQISQAREVDLMPNALAIIGPVIDEVVDEQNDDGDKMEIDGKGPDSTETLAACVQCLLHCLNPATAETEGTLIESSPVELSCQLNLDFFFLRFSLSLSCFLSS
jgi:proteasome component ECM29